MPDNGLAWNLDAMQNSLRLLNNNPQFKAQINSLDQQLAQIKGQAAQLSEVDPNSLAIALVELPTALPGITSGILLAIDGFDNGDVLSGIQGVMDTCASLAPVIGGVIGLGIGAMFAGIGAPVGGQVGVLVGMAIGSIFSLISDILGFFAPKAETVSETIERMLKDQKADAIYSGIGRVQRSFLIYSAALNDACKQISADLDHGDRFHPAVTAKVIDEMNFIEGNTMTTYWDVIDWLSSASSQTHPLWPLILNATCNAYSMLLMAIVRLQMIVNSEGIRKRYVAAVEAKDENMKRDLNNLWSSAAAKLQVYAISNRLNLRELEGLRSAVRSHGTLWRTVPGIEVNLVDPAFQSLETGGYFSRQSATVYSKDQSKSDPLYYLYGVGGQPELFFTRVKLETSQQGTPVFSKEIHVQLPFRVQDVFATPGVDPSKPNHALVYTITEDRRKMEGKFFDETGKQMGDTFFSYQLPDNHRRFSALNSVRSVHNPYSYADDPANGALKDIGSIVYALCEQKKQPMDTTDHLLILLNGKELREIPAAFLGVRGVEVDQDYVWVYSETQACCASHASVVNFKPGHSGRHVVAWSPCPNLPGKVKHLYPCDDGTVLADVENAGTFSAGYQVDRTYWKITSSEGKGQLEWIKVRNNAAISFEKLPLFCWPQYESLTDTLNSLQQIFNRS